MRLKEVMSSAKATIDDRVIILSDSDELMDAVRFGSSSASSSSSAVPAHTAWSALDSMEVIDLCESEDESLDR